MADEMHDLDPNETIEFDHDPETDTEEDPAYEDDGYVPEPVEGAEPVSDDITDADLPTVALEDDEEEGE